MRPLGLDTSVAVPLLVQTHSSHADVVRWLGRRPAALSGHACAETYSVLTRLPGDARLTPVDAARLLVERLASPMLLAAATAERLPALLAEAGVEGGAVYDALVGLAALDNDAELATRDLRARNTYDVLGVRWRLVA
ncbi:MAG TPA: PIN domain-containing protein [Mycobacteriales bacterium]|jgi:predicted nucleic acid-binding protein|nr:PIN domain-containing protein [Mycobacteriales bacterium]